MTKTGLEERGNRLNDYAGRLEMEVEGLKELIEARNKELGKAIAQRDELLAVCKEIVKEAWKSENDNTPVNGAAICHFCWDVIASIEKGQG